MFDVLRVKMCECSDDRYTHSSTLLGRFAIPCMRYDFPGHDDSVAPELMGYQIVKKQVVTDRSISDLVDMMTGIFDFTQDADRLQRDASRLQGIIADTLRHVAECAIFVCKYFDHKFGGMLTIIGDASLFY